MSLKVVSDSTPLIALSKINKIHILQEFFGTVIIPEAVFHEITSDKESRGGRDEVLTADWIQSGKVTNPLGVRFLSINLDDGEAEAITLAEEIKADLLLMDEKDGRKAAKSLGIPITGTVGLLLRHYRGDPAGFKTALDELIAKGFRLAQQEYEKFLKMAR